MAIADITLRITRLSMTEMYQLGLNVEAALRDNPYFPKPKVPLDQLRALLTDFLRLINAASDGSKQAYIERNACALQLRFALERSAAYVRMESNGSAIKLSTSASPCAKSPCPSAYRPLARG
jgi:hypothetical protein